MKGNTHKNTYIRMLIFYFKIYISLMMLYILTAWTNNVLFLFKNSINKNSADKSQTKLITNNN